MNAAKNKISPQVWMVAAETVKVMDALHAGDGAARFVGGCVRNALVNKKVIDIDIATPLTPDQVIERLEGAKIQHVPTGLKHGTVTAIVDGKPFEITTLRKDLRGYGRHADVLFTDDWRVDASRRDFTMNALYAERDGTLHDYYGGVEDLRRGRVFFIGNPEDRIREDILRILRFFRFYAHFGQEEADPSALRACRNLSSLLPKLSVERIRQEILKLLESDRSPDVWRLMMEHGVTTHFLPEATNVPVLKRLVKLEYIHHGGVDPIRRLSSLLEVVPEAVSRIGHSLKLSNVQAGHLARFAVADPNIHTRIEEAAVRRLVYAEGNDMARALLLLTAAREGKENNLFNLYGEATSFRSPRFPLVGDDVMALGISAGPEVGLKLKEIETWWIGQDFQPGRTECLKKLRDAIPPALGTGG